MTDDEFLTIKHQQQAEIKVKGSRFIGTAHPVTTEEQAKDFISQISQKFFDATHNCYAFTVGINPLNISRYNDDGEPAGTAGQPILNVINGKKFTNIVVVITRYFGGTKLGKGGLIRAYSDCTQEVLDKCIIIKKYLYEKIKLKFNYELTGPVMRTISQYEANILDSKYDQQTKLELSIRRSKVNNFVFDLTELTAGKVRIIKND